MANGSTAGYPAVSREEARELRVRARALAAESHARVLRAAELIAACRERVGRGAEVVQAIGDEFEALRLLAAEAARVARTASLPRHEVLALPAAPPAASRAAAEDVDAVVAFVVGCYESSRAA